MNNLEWLRKMEKLNANDDKIYAEHILLISYGYRQARASEIIAGELIAVNANLCSVITTLENIETTIKQGR